MTDQSDSQYVGRLRDAIHWARSVHNDKPELWRGEGMGIAIHEQLLPFVHSRFSIGNPAHKITILRSKEKASHIHGCLVRTNKDDSREAAIIIPANANYCWSRFAATKELSHILTDTQSKYWCKDVLNQLQIATDRPGSGDGTPLSADFANNYLSSEHFCYFMAIEITFPWGTRCDSGDDPFKGQAFSEVARKYRMPEAVVEHACKCAYFKLSREINTDLDSEGTAILI